MIYEMRRYILQPGRVAEWEKAFGDAYQNRAKYSQLGGLWHTDIGPLNEVIHIWPYENLQHRAEVRAESAKDAAGNWPPSVPGAVVTMETDILNPVKGMTDWTGPQQWGNLYEMRQYTYAPGTLGKVAPAFGEAIAGRAAIYPVAGVFTSTLGNLNRMIQLFPFKDWNHRDEVREEFLKTKVWPPHTDASPVAQLVRHMIPADCSPLH